LLVSVYQTSANAYDGRGDVTVKRVWLEHYEESLPAELELPPLTLPDILFETTRELPDRAATSFMGGRLDYRTLSNLVRRLAGALAQLGTKPGDRVALHLPNTPQFIIGLYGILQVGAVAVPINPLYQGEELAFVLRDSGARAVITLSKLYPNIVDVLDDSLPLENIIVTPPRAYFRPG